MQLTEWCKHLCARICVKGKFFKHLTPYNVPVVPVVSAYLVC